MDTKRVVLIGTGLGLSYYIYKQYVNAKELGASAIISPKDVSLDTTHVLAPRLVFKVDVTNPSPNSVTINKLFGVVSFQGQQIGTINNNESQTIKATSTSTIDLDITLSSFDVAIALARTNLSAPIDLQIKGYYVANQIQLPLLLDYSLPKIGLNSNNQLTNTTGEQFLFMKLSAVQSKGKVVLKVWLNSNKISGQLENISLILSDYGGNNNNIATVSLDLTDKNLKLATQSTPQILKFELPINWNYDYSKYKKLAAEGLVIISGNVYQIKTYIPVVIKL